MHIVTQIDSHMKTIPKIKHSNGAYKFTSTIPLLFFCSFPYASFLDKHWRLDKRTGNVLCILHWFSVCIIPKTSQKSLANILSISPRYIWRRTPSLFLSDVFSRFDLISAVEAHIQKTFGHSHLILSMQMDNEKSGSIPNVQFRYRSCSHLKLFPSKKYFL